jgi:hypothetical protein
VDDADDDAEGGVEKWRWVGEVGEGSPVFIRDEIVGD